ncbi:hypothetical protein JCM24511_01510 [Saitozyma sp. JCM 24511]|nr:hypothetical protein JCM24511_01510 [Saitozyma sp. JCM 24511]
MLDAANAFNAIPRSRIASAISKYAPRLSRLAYWAYNNPSPLLVLDPTNPTSLTTILSTQGVPKVIPWAPTSSPSPCGTQSKTPRTPSAVV